MDFNKKRKGDSYCQWTTGGARKLMPQRTRTHLTCSTAGTLSTRNKIRKADAAKRIAGREEATKEERKNIVSTCDSVWLCSPLKGWECTIITPFTTCEWVNSVIPPKYAINNKGRNHFSIFRNFSKSAFNIGLRK